MAWANRLSSSVKNVTRVQKNRQVVYTKHYLVLCTAPSFFVQCVGQFFIAHFPALQDWLCTIRSGKSLWYRQEEAGKSQITGRDEPDLSASRMSLVFRYFWYSMHTMDSMER